MKIAFDAIAIYSSKDRGIGKYTISHINEMTRLYPDDEFYYFNPYGTAHIGTYLTARDNLHEVVYDDTSEGLTVRSAQYTDIFGAMVRIFIERYDIDVFYITCPFPGGNAQRYRREWFGRAKVAATFYDLIPLVFEERYLSDRNARIEYMESCETLRFIDHFFAISQSAKDDLCRYLNIPEEKITVIWGAADERFRRIDYASDVVRRIKKKYHIKDKFIMCTGGDDERKNIAGLIEAYSRLPAPLMAEYQLVIVCKLSSFSVSHYSEVAKNAGVSGRVIFTNFVTDEEQLILYNTSSLQAFVSKYEGLGLPVLEAYQCRVPVVTANNSSLVQIGQDAAFIADADDTDSICEAIKNALTMSDEERQRRQKRADELVSETFNCGFMARTTVDTLHGLYGSKRKPLVRRLAYFTPLPPVQSGISDFSVDVLTQIARYYDKIDVIIDEGYTPDCTLPENVGIVTCTDFAADRYDRIVYQFGNSSYHVYMLDFIDRFGGIVELHDVNCHGLAIYLGAMAGENWQDKYRELLCCDLSAEEADAIAANGLDGENTSRAVINGFAVRNADSVIVHSEYGRNAVFRNRLDKKVDVIPLYAVPDDHADRLTAKKELGYAEDDILLSMFGIVHENKQASAALKALGKLHRDGCRFKVAFVGKTIDSDYQASLYSLAEEYGLSDSFLITGYTELDTFEKHMTASDICLNLRCPYNGENSASLCRLLSKGKCTLVNDIGSFAEVPDDACVILPDFSSMSEDERTNCIYKALEGLLSSPEKCREIGKNAFAYASEQLNIRKIGKMYVSAFERGGRAFLPESAIRRYVRNELAHRPDRAQAIEKFAAMTAKLCGAEDEE